MKKKIIVRKDKEEMGEAPEILIAFARDKALAPLENTKANITNLETSIKTYEEAVKEYNAKLKTEDLKLEVLEANKDTAIEKETAKAKEMYGKFSKNICFNSLVSCDNGYLIVETNLLFANIRKDGGLRLSKRACLGAFKVALPLEKNMNRDYVWVENLTFKGSSGRAHWAVASSRICWGGWRTEIDDALRKGDYYQMFEVIMALIRASDDDAAAYISSHMWRDDRDISNIYTSKGEKIVAGDYILFVSKEHDNLEIKGHVAQVVLVRDTLMMKTIIKRIAGAENFEWNVPTNKAMKIPKEMYDAQEYYYISDQVITPVAKIIHMLDELPEGTSNDEAINLIKSEYEGKKIRLDLKKLMS